MGSWIERKTDGPKSERGGVGRRALFTGNEHEEADELIDVWLGRRASRARHIA